VCRLQVLICREENGELLGKMRSATSTEASHNQRGRERPLKRERERERGRERREREREREREKEIERKRTEKNQKRNKETNKQEMLIRCKFLSCQSLMRGQSPACNATA
jgi:hypothetical protein